VRCTLRELCGYRMQGAKTNVQTTAWPSQKAANVSLL
jgi:hypothetical protein